MFLFPYYPRKIAVSFCEICEICWLNFFPRNSQKPAEYFYVSLRDLRDIYFSESAAPFCACLRDLRDIFFQTRRALLRKSARSAGYFLNPQRIAEPFRICRLKQPVYFIQFTWADFTSLEFPPIMIVKSPASQSYFSLEL